MKSATTNQHILKEDPDTVTKEDGTVLHNHDKDSYPFFFDRGMGMLVMGGAGVLHDDMLGDVYDALGQYAPDEEEQDNYYSAFIGEYESADPNLVTGRIWTGGRVISLWMPTDKKTLEDITYCFDTEYGINTDGYQLDMGDKTVSLDDFLYGEEEKTPEFTHPEVHTMASSEKWGSPQLTGARETANKVKAEKLGSTPEAKYNFYRRYGMGDSVQHNENSLNESPDTVRIGKNSELTFNDDDAYPFVYDLKSKHLFISDSGNTHGDIEWDIEDYLRQEKSFSYGDAENYARRIASRKSRNSIVGRIWNQHHVISFWKMPSSQSALKETVDALCKELGQDVWSYNVDARKGRLVPLKNLMEKEKPEETHFDLDTIHNLSPKEKWDTSQLKGARETANQAKAEKLGSTPEAEYNFYRRYGMGDSQQHEGQPLTESPDSLMWTNEWGKPEEICYLADDARPFFYDTEKDDLYLYPRNITHYEVIAWIKWLMKAKYPEMTDAECEKRAKEADNRRSPYGFSGRIWIDSRVISFWVTPPVNILEKIVKKFNEQRIRVQEFSLDLYDFADSTTLGNYIKNEKETDYSGMEPEPWFDLDIVHNLPAEEKWNSPQLKGARETADKVKAEKLKGMTQAEYNFYKNYGLGDSVQHQEEKLTESPDYMFGIRDGEPVEGDFHNYESKAFVYDTQTKKFYVGSERSQHAHLFDWIVDEVLNDNPDWYVEDAEEYVRDLLARNSDTGINGRVWFDDGVVSFWNMPSIDVLRDMANNCDFNLKDFYVDEENCDEEMKTVGQILCSGKTKATNFDLSAIHNINAKEKHDNPQLTGARETADKVKAEKLGGTPEAEYNFYRRYGMGDSITRKGALLKEDPDTVDFHDGSVLWFDYQYAYPFIYDSYDDIFFLGEESETHADMYDAVKETLIINRPDEDEEDIEWKASNMTENRDEASYWYGRIWTQEKVISIWDNPPHKDVIRIFDELEKNFGSLNGYVIDMGDWGMPIEKYLSDDDEKNKKPKFDLAKVHLMPAEKKRNTPQMRGARELRDNLKAQKLGSTPEAEHNFYRRYGMGDSKENDNTKQINEVEAENISLQSFVPQAELNPRFWVNGKLNSNVRIKLLQIAHNFMDESKVNWVEPEDVVLTGSIANYNWSKYSDVDVHIILDYNKVWKKTEFVEDYFGDKKELWSSTHPNLKIYGFPVEVYVEDLNAPADSSGIFSLLTNEWLKEPVDFNDSSINGEYVKSYAARIETKIDNIIAKMKKERNVRKIEDYSKALQAIFDKLKNIRKEGLKKGGEMGSGNIIWKICKRMGYIDKLWNYVNLAYDKTHSII